MPNDELDVLIVKENEVIDKMLLATLLKNYLKITETGEVVSEEQFFSLDAKKKILVFLLARKVMKLKGIGHLESEDAGPKEISDKIGIPFGTVGRTLRELVEKNVIQQTESGKYRVPNFNLHRVKQILGDV